FDDGPDVIGRARHVAQHDGCRAPVRDERKHDAADDDRLRNAAQFPARPGTARIQLGGHDCLVSQSARTPRGAASFAKRQEAARSNSAYQKTKVRATLVLDESALSKSVSGDIPEPADEVS